MLDILKTSELHSGFFLASCPHLSGIVDPAPDDISFANLDSPKAIYIVRSVVLEPRGWMCTQLYDAYALAATGGHSENLCPLIQPLGCLPPDYSIQLPKTIFIPNSDSMLVLALNMTVVNSIRAPDNEEPFAKYLRDKVSALLDQLYYWKDYDQTRLQSGRGKGRVAVGPLYVAKTSAQCSREEVHGQAVDDTAVGDTAKLQAFAFLASLYDYDYDAIRALVGSVLDFKASLLPGTLSDN